MHIHTCIHIDKHTCLDICRYVHPHICTSTFYDAYTHVHTYIQIYIHTCVQMYINIHICKHTSQHTNVYTMIHIYTYIHYICTHVHLLHIPGRMAERVEHPSPSLVDRGIRTHDSNPGWVKPIT